MASAELGERVEGWLAALPPREAYVLRRRFGLANGFPESLEDVGRDLRVTRERVRQIQNDALKRLRANREVGMFRDYVGS